MFVLIRDGSVAKFPCSVGQFRRDNPNVGLPLEPSEAQLSEVGLFPVAQVGPPTAGPTQDVIEAEPEIVNGVWTQRWVIVDAPAQEFPARLASAKADFIRLVDAQVDVIYQAVIGNRGPEYAEAEAEAKAFIASGYAGAAPPSVTSWMAAKGWTAQQAADDIMQAASQLNGAKQAIRAERLLRKEQARNATAQTLPGIIAAWSAFVSAIRSQLGA